MRANSFTLEGEVSRFAPSSISDPIERAKQYIIRDTHKIAYSLKIVS